LRLNHLIEPISQIFALRLSPNSSLVPVPSSTFDVSEPGWQKQRGHSGYMNLCGQEWQFKCGLVIPIGVKHEVLGLEHWELDAAHRARGHRALPDFGDQLVAFLFDYT